METEIDTERAVETVYLTTKGRRMIPKFVIKLARDALSKTGCTNQK